MNKIAHIIPTPDPASLTTVDITSTNTYKRAQQMWLIAQHVVQDLDSASSDSYKTSICKYFTRVAWHESAYLTTRTQIGGGPARGILQFEPKRAYDGCETAKSRNLITRLAQSCGTTKDLWSAAQPLRTAQRFPADNLVLQCLMSCDLFTVYLARIWHYRLSESFPATLNDQANLWFNRWNCSGVPERKTKFIDDARLLANTFSPCSL